MKKILAEHYDQMHKMTDDIQNGFFPLLNSEKQVLKLLYLWDRTLNNNGNTLNVIDYEQLIYFELLFKDNEKIQQLINNIKSKTYSNYVLIHKYIKRVTDNLCEKNIEKMPTDVGIDFQELLLT